MDRQEKVKRQRKGSGKLPTLITKNVDSPWDEVLSKLARPITKLYPKPEQALCARNASLHRLIVTCWVVKLKWNPPGLKMPRTRSMKEYKALGEMFRWILQFCIECHPLMSERHCTWWNETYPNAWRWFDCVFNELLSVPESVSNSGSNDKAKQEQAEVNMLKDCRNPYKREDNLHIFWLFEAATQMAEQSGSFYAECYLKFLNAKRAHITNIKKGAWRYVRVDEKGLYYLDGKGSYKKRFPSYTFQRWLEQLTIPETQTQQGLQELVFRLGDSKKKY